MKTMLIQNCFRGWGTRNTQESVLWEMWKWRISDDWEIWLPPSPCLVPRHVLADSRATGIWFHARYNFSSSPFLASFVSTLNVPMVHCAKLLYGSLQSRFPLSTLETPRNEAAPPPGRGFLTNSPPQRPRWQMPAKGVYTIGIDWAVAF